VFTIDPPGVIRQGSPFLVRSARIFRFGIAGDQHGIDRRQPLGRPDKVDLARDFAVEEIAGIATVGSM